jgi:hypothetical protein
MRKVLWLLAIVLAVSLTTQVQSASKSGGVIKVVSPGLVLDVKTPDGKVVKVPANKETPAPADTYQTAAVTLYAPENGAKGPVWSIESRGPFGSLKNVTVDDGKTTQVEGGAPLTVKTSVAQTRDAKGPCVSIGLAILGKAGESYNTGTIKRGTMLVPKPKIQILDKDGKELASGSFEYG